MRLTNKEFFARKIHEMDDEDFVFTVAHDAPYLNKTERAAVLWEIDRRWNYMGVSTNPNRSMDDDKSLELLKEAIG